VNTHLFIAKAGPAVRLGLLDEGLPRPPAWSHEQRLAAHRVEEGDLSARLGVLAQEARAQPVAAVLRVVPVVAAYIVGRFPVTAPLEGLLRGLGARAVGCSRISTKSLGKGEAEEEDQARTSS